MTPDYALAILGLDVPAMLIDSSRAGSGLIAKCCELGDPNDFGVALKVAEDLLAERVRDLGIYAGVLDVAVSKVVSHVLDAAASVEKMDGNRVAERVDRSPRNP